jgi:hypothetical protein
LHSFRAKPDRFSRAFSHYFVRNKFVAGENDEDLSGAVVVRGENDLLAVRTNVVRLFRPDFGPTRRVLAGRRRHSRRGRRAPGGSRSAPHAHRPAQSLDASALGVFYSRLMRQLFSRVWAFPLIALAACSKGNGDAPATAGASASAAKAPAGAAPTASAKPAAPPTATATATAADTSPGACGLDGAYLAVGYACKGEAQQPFPSFMQWNFTMSGTNAPFVQTSGPPLPVCALSQVYKATCASSPTVVTLTPAGPSACSPANCAMHKGNKGIDGTACGKTPEPLLWTVVEHTAKTLVLTSVEPFKLTTCTANHKSNPLTVWWQKK